MPKSWIFRSFALLAGIGAGTFPANASNPAELVRVESVQPAARQPHSGNRQVIWYDDFDADRIAWYLEPKAGSPDARRSLTEHLGGQGGSMECFYGQGRQGIGNRKLVFGDCPFGKPLRAGERFNEIYWRIYVKHQQGWVGTPAKMSRATGFVSSQWNQAFISHVWSSGLPLTLDPASGVLNGQVVTTVYNDFNNLHWLGNKPVGKFPIHATAESGRWVCVESKVRVNTPGQKDGSAALWVDGILDTVRTNLDFIGTYTGKGSAVNAIFLEAYWNEGSPVNQYRWYDDFVISTEPIGPITADSNPVLIKTPWDGCDGWEAEIAADAAGAGVVWKSRTLPPELDRVAANPMRGAFVGLAEGQAWLPPGIYFCRTRQRNREAVWSPWSAWHQPFRVSKRTEGAYLDIQKKDQTLRLNLFGEPATSYAIESSHDLTEWSVVTNVVSPGQLTEFEAPQASFAGSQFYRAR